MIFPHYGLTRRPCLPDMPAEPWLTVAGRNSNTIGFTFSLFFDEPQDRSEIEGKAFRQRGF